MKIKESTRLSSNLSEINVVPLVDVMLVLLIIFMVTAPMMKTGINVNLPSVETEANPSTGTQLQGLISVQHQQWRQNDDQTKSSSA